jgi:hypothetical protein
MRHPYLLVLMYSPANVDDHLLGFKFVDYTDAIRYNVDLVDIAKVTKHVRYLPADQGVEEKTHKAKKCF